MYSPEQTQRLLAQYYKLFVESKSYEERHNLISAAADVQRNSIARISTPMSRLFSARLFITSVVFGRQHAKRNPECQCLD